jgi:class 3 adenylate cyclase
MPTFMFADLAGFTALTEAHGDADASALAHRFEMLVRGRLPAGARLVKMMGDAAMVVAQDVLPIVLLARELLTAVDELPGRPAVRIGIHTGEAIERDGDYWGHAVNVAARLAARAEPCEILTTEDVQRSIASSSPPSDLIFEPLGPQQLRNVSETLELFAIHAERLELPTDPVCRMRLSDSEGAATIHFEGRTYHFCSLDCTGKFAGSPSTYATEG